MVVKVSVKQNWKNLTIPVTYYFMFWNCLQKMNILQCAKIKLMWTR